jgi:hypothetical protein
MVPSDAKKPSGAKLGPAILSQLSRSPAPYHVTNRGLFSQIFLRINLIRSSRKYSHSLATLRLFAANPQSSDLRDWGATFFYPGTDEESYDVDAFCAENPEERRFRFGLASYFYNLSFMRQSANLLLTSSASFVTPARTRRLYRRYCPFLKRSRTNYGEHYVLLGFTVWASLIGVVMFGTLAGSMSLFILRRLGFDPAASSAPFVATLVNVTGLCIYFLVALVILRGTLL